MRRAAILAVGLAVFLVGPVLALAPGCYGPHDVLPPCSAAPSACGDYPSGSPTPSAVRRDASTD